MWKEETNRARFLRRFCQADLVTSTEPLKTSSRTCIRFFGSFRLNHHVSRASQGSKKPVDLIRKGEMLIADEDRQDRDNSHGGFGSHHFLLTLVFLGKSRKISSKLKELKESSLRACKMSAYDQIRKRRK